jgi:serine/threonine protein phosphatase PrpC
MTSGLEQARVNLEAWLVTDVGVVRDHNEDSAFMDATKGFFIVADGMGGHAAGEVASAMAVETVRSTLDAAGAEIEAFKKAPSDAGRRGIVQLLQSAVLSAHQAVYQRGQAEQDKAGMGTTLDVVLVAGPEAFVAHVGDSRTYLIREGRSSQITTDHTVAEVLVIEGKLTIEEAQVSPLRTILVNAIGVSADVGVEMAHVTLKRGDRLLLCSDGLHDYFPVEEEIAQKLSSEAPGDALKEMVELAKTRGGHDNITGVAIDVAEIHEGVPAQIEGESTQPVDLTANPFASDEPTETAYLAPPSLSSRLVSATAAPAPVSVKPTQPMRAVSADELKQMHAETIPPPQAQNAKPEPKAEDSAATRDATAEKPNADDKVDGKKADEKADDKKPEKVDEKKPEKPKKGKKGKKAAAESKSDGDGASEDDDGDGTPTEIGTADTGRVVLPKDSDAS